ncbi:DNA polymerase I [Scatolibacter rhodanostii]|uniref:DNA polymerase I n=1 Tax=Scatolibacter rhodanostii TaxID=2014781 RepID=UPI000C07AF2D|nr:DNA polymerase I [Scatolibacter rhodanostii]
MKLLVLDGNSIVNRAFYGVKLLSTKDGTYTNAVHGFFRMFKKLLDEAQPDATAIAFDLPAPTFRHKRFEGYKGKRKGMPEELAQQMPIIKELLTDMGYQIVSCEGWEADDILGTLAAACEKAGNSCMIATGDRDSLQLVSDSTTVRLASTKFGQPQVTLYDVAKIQEEYGVEPRQLIDIKAIQGDTSDNIPGVAGIGQKGAAELIQKFGTLKAVYDNIEDSSIKAGMKKKLEEGKESAFLSYELGEIRKDAPVETDIQVYQKSETNHAKIYAALAKLELFKLIEEWNIETNQTTLQESGGDSVATSDSITVQILADGSAVLARCADEGKAVFYTQYDKSGKIEKMIFAIEKEFFEFAPSESFLRAFFTSSIPKYTSDVKLLHKAALKMGINGVKKIALDTTLASYLINPSSGKYEIPRLAAEYQVSMGGQEDEGMQSAVALPEICNRLEAEIKENAQEKLLQEIEIPLALVLAKMEIVGFYVDKQGIAEYGQTLQVQIEDLQTNIIREAGMDFNINSPKQLGEILFSEDKLALPHGKKTKTGWSTNAEVLEEIRGLHPIVDYVLEYRTLSKLKSTYCDGLTKLIDEDGRIHSSFNQTETRTGRISSTEPNLQNIPVRTAVGRELRKFFAAEHGILADADYSQIELRVLAHVADDAQMQEDFREERDIHTATAGRVFGLPQELVTSEMRSKAKAVNFGIVYGIGAFSLSKDIHVSVAEAGAYIKEYLKNYSGVDNYMKAVVEEAKEKGYVETLFGRRRYLPEIKSSNFNMRSFGERVARNMPIQGAAADIIKIAMIRVSERIEKENLQARLILQVHDELIVECSEDEKESVKKILEEEMEKAANLAVPLKVEANFGETWYDAKA